jgi:large subunit ribosomal protein L4
VIGQTELSDSLFGAELARGALYQSVKAYLANRRQGTASTKTRSEVDLTKRKIYRQKGTGRARAGTAGSPVRVGGGVAHGPRPHAHSERVPKKVRRLAIRSAFSAKASSGGVKVVEDFTLDSPKTRVIAHLAQAIRVEGGRALLLLDGHDPNVAKSCRNVPRLDVKPIGQVCSYDILLADTVLFTRGALGKAESMWGQG